MERRPHAVTFRNTCQHTADRLSTNTLVQFAHHKYTESFHPGFTCHGLHLAHMHKNKNLQELAGLGVDVVRVPRGGETTYHGPGQLVAYPVLDLRQLGLGARAYVESLEDAMVQAVGCFGIQVRAGTMAC